MGLSASGFQQLVLVDGKPLLNQPPILVTNWKEADGCFLVCYLFEPCLFVVFSCQHVYGCVCDRLFVMVWSLFSQYCIFLRLCEFFVGGQFVGVRLLLLL